MAFTIPTQLPKIINTMNKYHHLQILERRNIARMLNSKISRPEIARVLGFSPSTICREINRNSGPSGEYDPQLADEQACSRRTESRLKIKGSFATLITKNLQSGLSPDQIVMNHPRLGVCTQTIYNFIWRDYFHRGKLWKLLRYCGKGHRVRTYNHGPGKGRISQHQEFSIHNRPPSIGNRLHFGHWEMDLILGRGGERPLLVLIERKSRYVLAGFLKGKWSTEVAEVAKRLLRGFKVNSITTDNGPEFRDHKLIKESLHCDLYYADPYKSWQKGAVENANKLLREFFPKRTSFMHLCPFLPQQACDEINNRPRRALRCKTPASFLNRL